MALPFAAPSSLLLRAHAVLRVLGIRRPVQFRKPAVRSSKARPTSFALRSRAASARGGAALIPAQDLADSLMEAVDVETATMPVSTKRIVSFGSLRRAVRLYSSSVDQLAYFGSSISSSSRCASVPSNVPPTYL